MLVFGGRTHLRPVLVEVVDARDAAPVAVRIVHVFDVAGPVSRVTRHHGLITQPTTSTLLSPVVLFCKVPSLWGQNGLRHGTCTTALMTQSPASLSQSDRCVTAEPRLVYRHQSALITCTSVHVTPTNTPVLSRLMSDCVYTCMACDHADGLDWGGQGRHVRQFPHRGEERAHLTFTIIISSVKTAGTDRK